MQNAHIRVETLQAGEFYLVHPPATVSPLITPKQEVRRKLKRMRAKTNTGNTIINVAKSSATRCNSMSPTFIKERLFLTVFPIFLERMAAVLHQNEKKQPKQDVCIWDQGQLQHRSHHKRLKSLIARPHRKYEHVCHMLSIATCVSLCSCKVDSQWKVKNMNNYNQAQAGYSAPGASDDVPTKGHAGRNLKRELTASTLIINQLTDPTFL